MALTPLSDTSDVCLIQIFSWLQPSDLASVALVCQRWNGVQKKTDTVWKEYCLSILDDPTLYHCSWKEQYQTLQHWRRGAAKLTVLSSVNPFWRTARKFSLLKHCGALEICPRPDRGHTTFGIHNLLSGQIILEIDPQQHGLSTIQTAHLHENMWTVLDEAGKIACFDLMTGVCHILFTGKPVQSPLFWEARPLIHRTDQDIVTSYDSDITLWSARTGLSRVFNGEGPIYALGSTPNYIVYMTATPGERDSCVVAINKNSGVTQELEVDLETRSMVCNGPYVAYLSKSYQLQVLEDREGRLEQCIHTFDVNGEDNRSPIWLHIYRNWLCVGRGTTLRIWDVRTGGLRSTIPYQGKASGDFCLDSQRLLICNVLATQDPLCQREYSYSLYDFTHKN
jgi:hypothetical protein